MIGTFEILICPDSPLVNIFQVLVIEFVRPGIPVIFQYSESVQVDMRVYLTLRLYNNFFKGI